MYTSRIIKSGALIADTKVLLAHWDEERTAAENLAQFQQSNVLGKDSRGRLEDILTIFRQRYVQHEATCTALSRLVKARFTDHALTSVLYYFAAQADALLHDVVTELLFDRFAQGMVHFPVEVVHQKISTWVAEGQTTQQWSEGTIRRVAQGVMATLRDFGILEGKANKSLRVPDLPIEAFAFIAFDLYRNAASGEKVVTHPDWRLFFLDAETVERFFILAHQEKLLHYNAAGSVVRLDFPATSMDEYAHVIANGST